MRPITAERMSADLCSWRNVLSLFISSCFIDYLLRVVVVACSYDNNLHTLSKSEKSPGSS